LQITEKGRHSIQYWVISVEELVKIFSKQEKQKHLVIAFNASFAGAIQEDLKPSLDFILTDNANYESFSSFGEQLQKNKELCDLLIIVKNKSFCTHKAMIMTRAKNAFHTLISNLSVTKERPQIQIDDVEVEVFEIILNFIYTDKEPVFLSTDDIKKLLIAIAKYQFLERLENICLKKNQK